MKTLEIPFKHTGYFSDLICDYLQESPELESFYHRFPRVDELLLQAAEKQEHFPSELRQVLVRALKQQYQGIDQTGRVQKNIEKLGEGNTVTLVTGHQLNLFTGPLYFLYKIVTTIKLARLLNSTQSEFHFVPVYWMATEDHDFEEINHFRLKGKKIQWNRPPGGAVGRMTTEGLEEVFASFSQELGDTDHALRLKDLFKNAYLEHEDLSSATRYLVHQLFGDEGLVIVDGDDRNLKEHFVPYIKEDIFNHTASLKVQQSAQKLQQVNPAYPIQVNPREINFFYLTEGQRERIVVRDDTYFVLDTALEFSKTAMASEIENHPERFSPNVITRPLYQEVILPNVAYIGGAGELAYWLELKTYFEVSKVPFPVLLLRNSVLVASDKQNDKAERLQVDLTDLFMLQKDLLDHKVREISEVKIDFGPQKKYLEDQFKALYDLAQKTDQSFLGAVKAQEVKQKKGLVHLEKRLLKAQKRKLKDELDRLMELQNQLFPNQSLQERQLNFAEFYLEYGDAFLQALKTELNPLKQEFSILIFNS